MQRRLHLDPFGGAAGDMMLAALLDAGADEHWVREVLHGLGLAGWQLAVSRDRHQGMAGVRVRVELSGADAPARTLADVRSLLDGAVIPQEVRTMALAVFERLFEAEAAVHGVPLERAHLHEIAAVDAVVDIVGSCAALVSLQVAEVQCGPVAVGRGTVQTEHGLLPVPPPAVARLLSGVPLAGHGADGEMTTPTGAALLTTWSSRYGPPQGGRLLRVGVGLGTRRFEGMPNILRALVFEVPAAVRVDQELELVETVVDDCPGEDLAYLVERLRGAGARDAWMLTGVGRKGRPLVEVRALVAGERREEVLDVLFREGITLGARVAGCRRPELPRRILQVATPFGPVPVKVAGWRGRVVSVKPEADVCQERAERAGVALAEVQAAAREAAPRPGDLWEEDPS